MTRTASRSRATRAVTGMLAAALLLTACSGGTAAEQTGPSAGTIAGAATPAPLALLEGPIGSTTTSGQSAPDFEKRVTSTGLDEATAFFLARTRSTVDVIDGHTYVVHHEFPNGATAEVRYRLFAPTTMSPQDPPAFESEVVGDEYRYTMTYAVDTTAMPADMVAQVENGLPTATPARASATAGIQSLGLAPRGTVIAAAEGGGAHTLGVVVEGVISQGQESGIDAFVKAGEDRGFTKTAKSWDAYKSGKKVWEALEANDIIASALAQLDALEECAKNPTASLTQQEYAKDPSGQQKTLATIAASRFEIKASTAVLFTTLIADTGSALVAEAPWLGFLVSPAVNYTKDSQMEAIRSYVERAAAAVVPCVPKAYAVNGRVASVPAGIVVEGTICSLEREFVAFMDGDLVGRLTFTPSDASSGRTKFRGKVGNASINAKGNGPYTVSLSADGSTGAIDFPFTSTLLISQIPSPRRLPDVTRTGPVHLILTETAPCDTAG